MNDVLIVEDEPDIAELLVHYLKRDGFAPRVVTTGTAALMLDCSITRNE